VGFGCAVSNIIIIIIISMEKHTFQYNIMQCQESIGFSALKSRV